MACDRSSYVAVCRGFGLSEYDVRRGVATDVPLEEVFSSDSADERFERLLDTLSGSTRGVDVPVEAGDDALLTELRVALAAVVGANVAEALGDGDSAILDRLAAVQQILLDDEYHVVRLVGENRRFVVVPASGLAKVREQFGQSVSVDGRSVLHDDQPAQRSVDHDEHRTDWQGRIDSLPRKRPRGIVSDTSGAAFLDAVDGEDDHTATDDSDLQPLESGPVLPALEAPPSEPVGPPLAEPPVVASGDVEEDPIVARGRVDEDPIPAPGTVADATIEANREAVRRALDEPQERPALDAAPSEPVGPALDEPPYRGSRARRRSPYRGPW